MKNNGTWRQRLILKIILNIWTVLTMAIFIADFLSGNRFDSSASSIGVIYLALLGIYVGQKEYSRWKLNFSSQFLGEAFVIVWTIIMVAFVILAPVSRGLFLVPPEFAIIYASTIGVFAVSQQSKALKRKR